MIVQCENCKTRYQFSDALVEGEGVWVRCMSCMHVFFLENPDIIPLTDKVEEETTPEVSDGESPEAALGAWDTPIATVEKPSAEDLEIEKEPVYISDEAVEESYGTGEREISIDDVPVTPDETSQEGIHEEDSTFEIEIDRDESDGFQTVSLDKEEPEEASPESIDEVFGESGGTEISEQPPEEAPEEMETFGETGEDEWERFPDETQMEEPEEHRRSFSLKKLIVYLIISLLIVSGVYLWLFPDTVKRLVSRLPDIAGIEMIKAKMGISQPDMGTIAEAITFRDVKERFTQHWIYGNILVVEGSVVNGNNFGVQKIRVRGNLLDASGNLLVKEEAFCGNILTDEELGNLTEKEIRKKLFEPLGRDVSNVDVPSQADIPFMLVFTNPPKKAGEFTVELASVEPAS